MALFWKEPHTSSSWPSAGLDHATAMGKGAAELSSVSDELLGYFPEPPHSKQGMEQNNLSLRIMSMMASVESCLWKIYWKSF